MQCGDSGADQACWCTEYPAILLPDPERDCLCSKCLTSAIATKIDEYVATVTPENAHASIAKEYNKDAKPVEGIDYYINEDGYFVFTKWYLLKRGYCCENGCKHCPYGFRS